MPVAVDHLLKLNKLIVSASDDEISEELKTMNKSDCKEYLQSHSLLLFKTAIEHERLNVLKVFDSHLSKEELEQYVQQLFTKSMIITLLLTKQNKSIIHHYIGFEYVLNIVSRLNETMGHMFDELLPKSSNTSELKTDERKLDIRL